MPIVSEDAYKRTEMIVNEFIKPGGIGEQLQKILLDTAETKDNWVIIYNRPNSDSVFYSYLAKNTHKKCPLTKYNPRKFCFLTLNRHF